MTNRDYWHRRRVLVTGGLSFIGSHLVEKLVWLGANVDVIDDCSSGKKENLPANLPIHVDTFDLRAPALFHEYMHERGRGIQTIFHLAADHGGRGYVDTHQAQCAGNLLLDGIVFHEAVEFGIEKIVFASSGCVYPLFMQTDTRKQILLAEVYADAGPQLADGMYGWAKLLAERTLRELAKAGKIEACSCRYFTVYGPRGKENHAVMAMIARAFTKQTPFEIWGDGSQIRNWTYVDDIVEGTILAGEKLNHGDAVNLGTQERITVDQAARFIMEEMGHIAEKRYLVDMPTGPMNRVADNSKAKRELGWEPQNTFKAGARKTIAWYKATKTVAQARRAIERALIERGV